MNILPSVNSEIMNDMANLANSLNVSSAELTLGENITGILLRQTDPLDIEEVSFAYASPKESINVSAYVLFAFHTCAM